MTKTTTSGTADMGLFWGCFIALIATSFGFIARVLTENEWAAEFGLSNTESGQILGVGLWPFAISIVLFSLFIDKVGYKAAMYFGLVCHIVSSLVLATADGYWGLYIGTLILALGSGTVEAYINPVVATMFSKDKTKWLNILHAGWPGGLVIGGIITILLGSALGWRLKLALVLIPSIAYAFMLFKKEFPTQERVAANVSYKDMLGEVGGVGAFLIMVMIMSEIGNVFALSPAIIYGVAILSAFAFAYYTKSLLGRPLFIILLLIMVLLATTELGVDSWITSLMASSMEEIGIAAGWVLVYTSLIMMLLRFYAGPIVHRISPLGLLAVSAALAALGLIALSKATGISILLAATLYGVGKSFFWPTTLGVVAEQFPKGGALTLNAMAGFGMIAVGILGAPALGAFQDQYIDNAVKKESVEMHAKYISKDKSGIFGAYKALDTDKVAAEGTDAEKASIDAIQANSQKGTLSTVAYLPMIMFICYILLILYFRSRGGYKPVDISES